MLRRASGHLGNSPLGVRQGCRTLPEGQGSPFRQPPVNARSAGTKRHRADFFYVPTLCVGMQPQTLQRPVSPCVNLQQPSLPDIMTGTRITPMFRHVDVTALYRIGMDVV